MKKNKRIIRVARIFVIMIIIITIWQCFKIVDTPLKINNEEIVEVAEGDSFYGILDKLSEEGKIKKSIDYNNVVHYQYLDECQCDNHFYLKCCYH